MPRPIAFAMPMRVHAKAIHRINSWPNFSLFGAPIATPAGQHDQNRRNWRNGVEGKRLPVFVYNFWLDDRFIGFKRVDSGVIQGDIAQLVRAQHS